MLNKKNRTSLITFLTPRVRVTCVCLTERHTRYLHGSEPNSQLLIIRLVKLTAFGYSSMPIQKYRPYTTNVAVMTLYSSQPQILAVRTSFSYIPVEWFAIQPHTKFKVLTAC